MTEPISLEYLENIQIESNISQSERNFIESILESLNDWRNSHSTLDEYLLEIENFVGGILTEQNIQAAIQRTNPLNNAWEIECLSGLSGTLNLYGNGSDLRQAISKVIANAG